MDFNSWDSRVSVDEDSNAVGCEAVNLYIAIGVSESLLPSSSRFWKSEEAASSSESLERVTNQNDTTPKET
jgi:hypothetical protein